VNAVLLNAFLDEHRNVEAQAVIIAQARAGGSDGLNMLVPCADDAYYQIPPNTWFAGDKILKLNSYAELNGKLRGLKALLNEGHLGVAQGVGYPNPNRSHFRSTEIWQPASDADSKMTPRYYNRNFPLHSFF